MVAEGEVKINQEFVWRREPCNQLPDFSLTSQIWRRCVSAVFIVVSVLVQFCQVFQYWTSSLGVLRFCSMFSMYRNFVFLSFDVSSDVSVMFPRVLYCLYFVSSCVVRYCLISLSDALVADDFSCV